MTAKPCAIADCPALAIDGSSLCAAHESLDEAQRLQERFDAEQRRFKLRALVPVTDRIEYEKKL